MEKVLVLFLTILAGIGIYSWLGGGALAEIQRTASNKQNPIAPFFLTQLGRTVETDPNKLAPKLPQVPGARISRTSPSNEDLENAKQFGDPSPMRGKVLFSSSGIYTYGYTAGANNEHVTLRANAQNTEPVTISGWSLQSVVTGNRLQIPLGTSEVHTGVISAVEAITLAPNEYATVVSGTSPLGVSFHTNTCSGYMAQFQTFVPPLPLSCPTPSEELPNTLDNLRTYGESCIDFVQTLPSCTYHLGSFPSSVSPACRQFVSEALTYNGCVNRHQFDANFSSGSWRIFLGSQSELWNNSHDVIRLLDAQGRTVDVWSY